MDGGLIGFGGLNWSVNLNCRLPFFEKCHYLTEQFFKKKKHYKKNNQILTQVRFSVRKIVVIEL